MFYQVWNSQLYYNPSTVPFWSSSTTYLLQSLSLALEKSVANYSNTLINSFPSSEQTQTVIPTTILSIKDVQYQSSPIKSDTIQKNSIKTIIQLEQPIKQEYKQKPHLSTQQTNKTLSSKEQHKSRDTANIPQFNPYIISQQHKITSLMQRQVDQWIIERPRRRTNRQLYNLS